MSPFLRTCALVLTIRALTAVATQANAMSLVRKTTKPMMNTLSGEALLQDIEEMARSGEAPAFDKVNEIKRIVQDELIKDLEATHKAAGDTVKSNLETIDLCNSQSTTRNTEIKGSTEVSVASTRTSHESCREEEKAKHATTGSKCGELDSFLDTINDPTNLPLSRPRAAMVAFVQTMSDYFCPKGPEVTTLDRECREAEAEQAEHAAVCNTVQATFESDFCTWRTELVDNCGTLSTCYINAEKSYKDHVASTTELVTKWKVEWGALQKILCYTDIWLSDNDVTTADAGAYASCNSKSIDDTVMDVDFGTAPPETGCPLTAVANPPGTSAFSTAEYSSVSDFVGEAIPCLGSPPTPLATEAPLRARVLTTEPVTTGTTTEPPLDTVARDMGPPPTTQAPAYDMGPPPTTEAPTSAPVGGSCSLLHTHGGWEFYKCPTTSSSDDGVEAACKDANLVVPCAGSSRCTYSNTELCTVTSEAGCGNPMLTTSKAMGCTHPSSPSCSGFQGVYTHMGKNRWGKPTGNACGVLGRNWCSTGSESIGGFAFCARAEPGSLAEVSAKVATSVSVDADGTVHRASVMPHAAGALIVEADGTVHAAALRAAAKCSSLPYTADKCTSGKLADNQDTIECGEDPCVDDAADDGLCCAPVEEGAESLGEAVTKSHNRSDLEDLEISELMRLVKSSGGTKDVKAALVKNILKMQGAL